VADRPTTVFFSQHHTAITQLLPNPPFQPTPLRVDKIRHILESGSSSNPIPTYQRGAAEWHSVRPQPIKAVLSFDVA
jgi:hypothetical protein